MSRTLRTMTQTSLAALMFWLVCVTGAAAQNATVSGVIKDETGGGLPGATVVEKGSAKGTVTDADGKFTLSVSDESAILVISFIGYTSQEVALAGRTSIEVTMALDITSLEEVVVVGYGTQKKSDLTGSVVSVSGDDLKKMPVSSVSETLTGRMAGVQVTTSEGSPDAEVNIRVRGGTSLSQDNSPLYIVDGFPINSISDISPSDIKSIDILKDASSTAIYGSRGANGVVIITTKGGSTDGKVSVSYNAFTGFKKIAKTLDVLSPEDYVKWQYEFALLEDDLPSYEDYFGAFQDMDLYAGMKGNDWQRQIYGRTGTVFSNDLSVRGGDEKFNFSANYALFNEKAIMVGSDFRRDNLTLKLNTKPTKKIELGFSVRYSDTKINGGGANEQNEVSSADSRLKHSVGYPPIPVPGLTTDTDDTNEQTAGDLVNPFIATADNDRYQERKNYNLGGSFSWKIIDNLQLKVEGGLDNYTYINNRFYGLTTYFVRNRPAAENQNHPAAILQNREEVRVRSTNTINYDFKKFLNETHHLNLLLGNEVLLTEARQMTSEIHAYPDFFGSDEAFRLTTQGKAISVNNSFSPDDKLLSFFARANYDYKGRYLLTAVYRADGSSKFLNDNIWGYFPSISAGWKVSEENFMSATSNWLNSLKLRASYGEAGNNRIPSGQTFQFYESAVDTWINGAGSYWAPSSTMANPDLKWETTITRNIGLDYSILSGRITGTFEYYQNNTKDLLILFPTGGTGYENQYRNMGETENSGLEASLTYAVIDKDKYGLNVSFNIALNRNEVKSLGDMDEISATSNWASTDIIRDYEVTVGNSIGRMIGYQNAGRYEVSDFEGYDQDEGWILKAGVADASQVVGAVAPGTMKLKDVTGDNIVNAEDMRIIGNANPKFNGGFTINGYAHGFDLTASFNYSFGNDVYNANKIEYTTGKPSTQYRNLTTEMSDGKRWTNLDPATGELVTDMEQLAAMNSNTTMWSPYMSRFVFSDWAVEDGSFLRLNTLTLGYTLPVNIATKLKLSNLRVYATGYNVFLITNYSGFDPEVSTRRRTPYTPAVDYSAYPRSRQIVFGLNFNF